jgi:hypothetical protein
MSDLIVVKKNKNEIFHLEVKGKKWHRERTREQNCRANE